MGTTDIYFGEVWQGRPAQFAARVVDLFGNYALQANFTSIAWAAFDLRAVTPPSPPPAVGSGTLVVANTIFNVLQQNPVLWPVDAFGGGPGYNFLALIDNSGWTGGLAFPNAGNGQEYRMEFTLTQTDGHKVELVCKVRPKPLLTSPL